jgi:hypothetical protein
MSDVKIPEDVRRAALKSVDDYRDATGDNGFNLSFDGTMQLLSMAILAERERAAKIAETPAAFMKFSGDFEGNQIAQAIRSSHD